MNSRIISFVLMSTLIFGVIINICLYVVATDYMKKRNERELNELKFQLRI